MTAGRLRSSKDSKERRVNPSRSSKEKAVRGKGEGWSYIIYIRVSCPPEVVAFSLPSIERLWLFLCREASNLTIRRIEKAVAVRMKAVAVYLPEEFPECSSSFGILSGEKKERVRVELSPIPIKERGDVPYLIFL